MSTMIAEVYDALVSAGAEEAEAREAAQSVAPDDRDIGHIKFSLAGIRAQLRVIQLALFPITGFVWIALMLCSSNEISRRHHEAMRKSKAPSAPPPSTP